MDKLSGKANAELNELREQIAELTGDDPLVHVESPGDGADRYVFRDPKQICHGPYDATSTARLRLAALRERAAAATTGHGQGESMTTPGDAFPTVFSSAEIVRLRRVLGVMPYSGGIYPGSDHVRNLDDLLNWLEALQTRLRDHAEEHQDIVAQLMEYRILHDGLRALDRLLKRDPA